MGVDVCLHLPLVMIATSMMQLPVIHWHNNLDLWSRSLNIVLYKNIHFSPLLTCVVPHSYRTYQLSACTQHHTTLSIRILYIIQLIYHNLELVLKRGFHTHFQCNIIILLWKYNYQKNCRSACSSRWSEDKDWWGCGPRSNNVCVLGRALLLSSRKPGLGPDLRHRLGDGVK